MPEENHAEVLLLSHMDVVNGHEFLFTSLIRDNKLFGRDSIDDKYAIALLIVMMKTMLIFGQTFLLVFLCPETRKQEGRTEQEKFCLK